MINTAILMAVIHPAAFGQTTRETVGEAAARLRARFKVEIVVEDGAGSLPAPRSDRSPDSIAAALDDLVAASRSVKWRRAILPDAARNRAAAKVCAAVRALEASGGRQLGVESRSIGSALLGNTKRDGDFHTVYVIFDGSQPADGLTPGERFTASQREFMDLMSELPPASRPNPMAAWVRAFQGRDKDIIERVMTPMMAAGMQAWERTSPEQRQAMMNVSMRLLNSPVEPRQGPGKVSPATSREYTLQLKVAADALAKQSHSTILIEPDLAVTALPPADAGSGSLEDRLDRLVAPLRSVAWRRVYLPQATEINRAFLKQLASDVRRLAALEGMSVGLPARGSLPSVNLVNWKASDQTENRIDAAGLNQTPVYLLYSRDGGETRPPSDRFADLLNRQMEMLLKMDSGQLSDAIDSALNLYQAGSAPPEDVLSLPVMTGMMGVWFPRAAKEARRMP